MPTALLDASVRFPTVYAPWYVYDATLVGAPAAYQYGDMLFPNAAGLWDRAVTDEQVLDVGYAFALEAFKTGDITVQVAVPGSAIPFIAEAFISPTQLVKFGFGILAAGEQSVKAALAADITLGNVLGRLRNHHETHSNLRTTAANDIVVVLTGVI